MSLSEVSSSNLIFFFSQCSNLTQPIHYENLYFACFGKLLATNGVILKHGLRILAISVRSFLGQENVTGYVFIGAQFFGPEEMLIEASSQPSLICRCQSKHLVDVASPLA